MIEKVRVTFLRQRLELKLKAKRGPKLRVTLGSKPKTKREPKLKAKHRPKLGSKLLAQNRAILREGQTPRRSCVSMFTLNVILFSRSRRRSIDSSTRDNNASNIIDCITNPVKSRLYACFIAVLGMCMNVMFPRYDWPSEYYAVKGGALSVLTTTGLGMLSSVIPLGLCLALPPCHGDHDRACGGADSRNNRPLSTPFALPALGGVDKQRKHMPQSTRPFACASSTKSSKANRSSTSSTPSKHTCYAFISANETR